MEAVNSSAGDNFQDDQATAKRAIAAIRIISESLDALGRSGALKLSQVISQRVMHIAYGWFAAAVRSSQLVALAHENGLRHESAATSRVVLQHALALQWLLEGGNQAADAVEADGDRRRWDLERELVDTGWPIPDGFVVHGGARPPHGGALQHQIANFRAMCELYVGGDRLYVPYRLLSGNAHPSYAGARAYIDPETGDLAPTAVTDTYAYLIEAARCLIQASKAFAALLAEASLTDAISNAEKEMGIHFALWQRTPGRP